MTAQCATQLMGGEGGGGGGGGENKGTGPSHGNSNISRPMTHVTARVTATQRCRRDEEGLISLYEQHIGQWFQPIQIKLK